MSSYLKDNYTFYIGLFFFYLITYFVTSFFSAALISAAYIRFTGGSPTLGDGLRQAGQHVGKILIWSVIAATIGTILQFIQNRSRTLGKIIIPLVEFAWSLVTFFVIPVLLFRQLSPWSSIKVSGILFKQTWSENAISLVSFGAIFMFIAPLGILIPLIFAFIGTDQLFWLSFILMMAYWVTLGIVSSTLTSIFKTALYIYATTGQVPQSFSPKLVKRAFVPIEELFK